MNLQSGNDSHQTRNHSYRRPPHALCRMSIQTRRGHRRSKLLICAELVLDFSENSLFVIRQWHSLIFALQSTKHNSARHISYRIARESVPCLGFCVTSMWPERTTPGLRSPQCAGGTDDPFSKFGDNGIDCPTGRHPLFFNFLG